MWRLSWLIFLHRKWRLPRLIFLHRKWRLPWLIFLHRKWRHPNLRSLYQVIRSYSGSHHLVSELRLLIQVLSYPIIFLCNLSRFVFLSLFCYLRSCLHLVSFLFAYCVLLFSFLFLSRPCSCFLCLSHCVKKNCKKKFEKKVGVWSLNTKLRHLEVFFLKENRGTNPLI